MSWLKALQIYLASPLQIRYRDGIGLFKRMATAQLQGPPGHSIQINNLSLLRQLRWEILKFGTPEQKSKNLETILICYANANNLYTYDPTVCEKENHILILEQIQCLVEARLAGIPTKASHYRYLLQSSQLSQLSPNIVILLIKEIEKVEGNLTDDIKLDASISLASCGHWKEALRLTPHNLLGTLIERISKSHRQGWRQACFIVSQLKEEEVTKDDITLLCFTNALKFQYNATNNSKISEKIEQILKSYVKRHKGKKLPKNALENFISTCSPNKWNTVLEFVVDHNNNVEDLERVQIGKVMALLNGALKWEKVLEIYDAKPSLISNKERQNSAVHNHALVALTKGNLCKEAIEFYKNHPIKNIHTYHLWLKMILIEGNIPFNITWESCIDAFNRLENPDHRYIENLIYNLIIIGEFKEALKIVKSSSKIIPRILLLGISISILNSNKEILLEMTRGISSSRHGISSKQLCIAIAIITCYVEDIPSEILNEMSEGLNFCTKSQEQFDDAIYHLGQYMAIILNNTNENNSNINVPPAINILISPKNNKELNAKSWIFVLDILKKMSEKGWSLEGAAPAMLSAGLEASVAINFLPN